MKKIEILGTGCFKCNKLAEETEKAAKELGIDYELVKVQDINDITAKGVMMTPALAVDGVVKCSGKVPDGEELKQMLTDDKDSAPEKSSCDCSCKGGC